MASEVPSGHREVRDQLRRSVLSIPLNIAEGVGKVTVGDRKKFYAIARGSAMECAACVDVLRILIGGDMGRFDGADELLDEVVRMLSTMSR